MTEESKPDWLTIEESRAWLRLSKSSFFGLMKNDRDFPPRYRFGQRGIRIRRAELEAYALRRVEKSSGGH